MIYRCAIYRYIPSLNHYFFITFYTFPRLFKQVREKMASESLMDLDLRFLLWLLSRISRAVLWQLVWLWQELTSWLTRPTAFVSPVVERSAWYLNPADRSKIMCTFLWCVCTYIMHLYHEGDQTSPWGYEYLAGLTLWGHSTGPYEGKLFFYFSKAMLLVTERVWGLYEPSERSPSSV